MTRAWMPGRTGPRCPVLSSPFVIDLWPGRTRNERSEAMEEEKKAVTVKTESLEEQLKEWGVDP
jgi:hypothetical protein